MEALETLLTTTLRMLPPILLAGLGGMLSSRVGLLNMGLEGMMLIGSFVAVVGSYLSGSSYIGLLAAMLVSGIIGLLFAVFNIKFKANNIVVGVAINMLALGITKYLLRVFFGVSGAFSSPKIVGLPTVHIEALESIPLLRAFNDQSIMVYIAFIAVGIIYFVMYHTPAGLRMRATGPHAMAVTTAGVSVNRMRYTILAISGCLCGLGGAHLSLGQLTMFTDNITNGRGFIAMAAAVFGNNTPVGTMLGAGLFGFTDAATMNAQMLGFPSQLVQMIPYIITILTLILVALRIKRNKLKPNTK